MPPSSCARNLATNYWAWRHGLPDLFLWRKDAAASDGALASAIGGSDGGRRGNEGRGNSGGSPVDIGGDRDTAPCLSDAVQVLEHVGNDTDGRSYPVSAQERRGTADSESLNPPLKNEAGCKWVEVKGPGDSLSCAQEAWIDTLVVAGAEAVLLRVEDSSSASS